MTKLTEVAFHLVAGAIIIIVYAGCSFDGRGNPLPTTPEEVNDYWQEALPALPSQTARGVINSDGRFKTVHGASCVNADTAATKDNTGHYLYGVRVDETLSTAGYNTATVFLNGWRLRYTSKDHHILGLSTGIVDIDHNQNQLRWKAGGILSDEKGDDEFTWCYYYTALLWNSGHLFDAIPYDNDSGAELTFLAPESNNRYIEENFSLDLHPGALLPRGFGLLRTDFRNDQHLNSFALDYSQNLFYTDAADGGYTAWQFNTRFQDRLGEDPYIATEVISILEGDSVELLEPDFDIIPGGPNGAPGTGYHDVVSRTIVVEEKLPFDYAVPMLTGWDIGLNSNDDSHIKEIGAWIASFNYDQDTGTLTYTIESAFHDKHKDGGNGAGTPRYKVSILGFNHLESIIQNPRFEDNPAKPDTIDGGFELPPSTNDIPAQPGTVKPDPFPTPASTETQPQLPIR